jgi:hypothetical protein
VAAVEPLRGLRGRTAEVGRAVSGAPVLHLTWPLEGQPVIRVENVGNEADVKRLIAWLLRGRPLADLAAEALVYGLVNELSELPPSADAGSA